MVLFMYFEAATDDGMTPAIGYNHTGLQDVAMSGQGAASHLGESFNALMHSHVSEYLR